MSETNILVAGFGGQGILFAGKFLVYAGLINGKQVSWLPSYGPEMRGGTASCGVIISDTPIGSPIVTQPDMLIVMNAPSLERYEPDCARNGRVFIDSSLITRELGRSDLTGWYVPAAKMADENGLTGLANMIMIGKFIKETNICAYNDIEAALKKTVPERRRALYDSNLEALNLGYNYRR
ncbi:MAG: 2-oxoacid:acceptor oxidoreductase family protein [Clostridiales bacterium]|jgi:2-oxoglutarate ferredoxin oxidoreductase subunit gamma|nr:2-oxoacid:acceptor oxidoreductase family protein [Clostridiales bacterium]